jgi:hypothetical protein
MAKEIPAAPNTGKAVFPRFRLEACFVRAIAKPPRQSTKDGPISMNW